jgi:glycosyltransferase involved in cell wall biosynthesis
MNIYFDARWTRFGVHDGISRYGANLVAALARLHPVTMIIYDKRQLKMLPNGIPYVIFPKPASILELLTPIRLNRLGADVVFSPMQVMGTWGRRYKLILTLHDVIYYQFPTPPHQLPALQRLAWRAFHWAKWPQRMRLNQADYIVTVSQTSRQLIQQMRLTDRKVGVVYNAPSLAPIGLTKTRKELVYVGSFMEYKNVELLVHAMQLLPDYKLHLVSKITPERKQELLGLAASPKQFKFWNGASDEQYNQLLGRAFALVSASRAEGFGLPLLEAMAQGVPAIATDMPIFHEVCEDAGTYFDPNSPESFAHAVHILENPMHHKTMIAKGRTQAAKFSWDKSAQELLRIMRQLCV